MAKLIYQIFNKNNVRCSGHKTLGAAQRELKRLKGAWTNKMGFWIKGPEETELPKMSLKEACQVLGIRNLEKA